MAARVDRRTVDLSGHPDLVVIYLGMGSTHPVESCGCSSSAARSPGRCTPPGAWRDFLRDSGGTGFWHELYSMRGGMEAVYDDMPAPVGMAGFAALEARRRADVRSARTDGPRGDRSAASGSGTTQLDSKDYSVHPSVIGRIEIHADLARVRVTCDGKTVADGMFALPASYM